MPYFNFSAVLVSSVRTISPCPDCFHGFQVFGEFPRQGENEDYKVTSLRDGNLVKHPKIKASNSIWVANGRKDLAEWKCRLRRPISELKAVFKRNSSVLICEDRFSP